MSWRRFCVLLRCLSPQSATVTKLQADRRAFEGRNPNRRREPTVEVKDPKTAQRAFELAFKPPS